MTYDKFFKYIKHYVLTSVISDSLIPYYDQNGRWCEESHQWEFRLPKNFLNIMKDSYLPTSRRTTKHGLSTKLLTSFRWFGNDSTLIPYSEISGSLMVGNVDVDAPCLRRVGIRLMLQSRGRVHLPFLE